jgi:hypothetical protein
MIENLGYSSTVGLTVIKKKDVAKHLQGRHNQKTHGGGMGPNWEKGQWHQMSDKEYVAFISDSHRLATSNAERRPISKTEWNKNYAKTDEAYLAEKPTRVYKNGKIVVFSNQSASPHHNSVNEGSFMRDVDDLQEKYPVDQLVIRIGDDIENVSNDTAFGATTRGGQGGAFMWIKGDALNPNQMRQGGHSMEAQYKTGVRTYVLSHEWGHAIDKPDVPLDFASKDTSIRRTLSKIYTYQGEEVLGKQIMSTYGNSDPSEAFAEAFVDYVVGQDRGKPSTNPLVVKMAETFGWDKPWKK